jgi:hypothetical protein
MSNQGWSRLPSKNKTAGEKVFAVVTWPFRKVFHAVIVRLLMRYVQKGQASDGGAATETTSPTPPAAPTPPKPPRR